MKFAEHTPKNQPFLSWTLDELSLWVKLWFGQDILEYNKQIWVKCHDSLEHIHALKERKGAFQILMMPRLLIKCHPQDKFYVFSPTQRRLKSKNVSAFPPTLILWDVIQSLGFHFFFTYVCRENKHYLPQTTSSNANHVFSAFSLVSLPHHHLPHFTILYTGCKFLICGVLTPYCHSVINKHDVAVLIFIFR